MRMRCDNIGRLRSVNDFDKSQTPTRSPANKQKVKEQNEQK